jgi:putative ATP-dependent endonuclease of OLD family
VVSPLVVESLTIRNFRGLDQVTLELSPSVTVLVGRNNSGKSRFLRAIGIALGGLAASADDFTVGSDAEPEIDVVIAPHPGASRFPDDVFQTLDPEAVQQEPVVRKFAFRTTIRRSREGFGARSDRVVLRWGPDGWAAPAQPVSLKQSQSRLWSGILVDTGRDLAAELTTRGTPIRRVLDDLEVGDDERELIEAQLREASDALVAASGSLKAVRAAFVESGRAVAGFGIPALNPLPRLEELARAVSLDLDVGTGELPMRLHGAGPRSLASLLTHRVLYERRLGVDGTDRKPHPLTLIEEPEVHLHPQMQRELPDLLTAIEGQVVLTTHSTHLVTESDPTSLRLLQRVGRVVHVRALRPLQDPPEGTTRQLRPELYVGEMEKLKRTIERPFGELLFASAVVIGDGATERALLPPLIRHALGSLGDGVVVIDPFSMGNESAIAAVKFAELTEIPWFLFADGDENGRKAVNTLTQGRSLTNLDGSGRVILVHESDATEAMLVEHDSAVCRAALNALSVESHEATDLVVLLKQHKGAVGRFLASSLIDASEEVAGWPGPIVTLVNSLRRALAPSQEDDGEEMEENDANG